MANGMQVSHTYSNGGDELMEDKKTHEFKFGNTKVIVHGIFAKLAVMTEEEKKNWWQSEYDRGNPMVIRMVEAIDACYE